MNETGRERFLSLCSEINREGMNHLIQFIKESDFLTAPASTKFHGNYEGGLLEHSLNVYDTLTAICKRHPELQIPKQSIQISALFHDICKANYYKQEYRSVKVYSEYGSKQDAGGRFDWETKPVYTVDDQMPLGHGEKSVIILQQYIPLRLSEIYAIRHHMGGFDTAVKGGDYSMSKAYEQCPLAVMLHLADMEATYLMESVEK